MKKTIEFTKCNWENEFEYAYNERFPFEPEFVQENDCISNKRNPGMKDGYDYTTIMTKDKYSAGVRLRLACLFEEYGAPLITFTDEVKKDKNGNLKYAACKEVVLWKNGINVWNIYVDEAEIKWELIGATEFHVDQNIRHELYVEINDDNIRAVVGDEELTVDIEEFPKEFYIGVTGCENINRIYSLVIEN